MIYEFVRERMLPFEKKKIFPVPKCHELQMNQWMMYIWMLYVCTHTCILVLVLSLLCLRGLEANSTVCLH